MAGTRRQPSEVGLFLVPRARSVGCRLHPSGSVTTGQPHLVQLIRAARPRIALTGELEDVLQAPKEGGLVASAAQPARRHRLLAEVGTRIVLRVPGLGLGYWRELSPRLRESKKNLATLARLAKGIEDAQAEGFKPGWDDERAPGRLPSQDLPVAGSARCRQGFQRLSCSRPRRSDSSRSAYLARVTNRCPVDSLIALRSSLDTSPRVVQPRACGARSLQDIPARGRRGAGRGIVRRRRALVCPPCRSACLLSAHLALGTGCYAGFSQCGRPSALPIGCRDARVPGRRCATRTGCGPRGRGGRTNPAAQWQRHSALARSEAGASHGPPR